MVTAFVIIHCDPGQEEYIIRNLQHIPQVVSADGVFGFYEVVCKIEADGEKQLADIITKQIPQIQHVRTKMTLNVIDHQS